MRLLLALFALCTLSTLAPADIIAIRFKDPKTATKHKDNAVLRGGELMLVGEKYEARSKDNTTVVIVANSDDPLKVPYKFNKAGELDGVKDTVSIANDQIAGTILLSKDGTLMSLAQDYSDRRRDYEEKRDEYRMLGIREYWVIDRFRRQLTVFRGDEEIVLNEADHYHPPLLPGFELPLAKILQFADRYP